MMVDWPSLGRQVHVGGQAEIAERALAEEIFAEPDRHHRLQSLACRQGEPIADLPACADGRARQEHPPGVRRRADTDLTARRARAGSRSG
jgi:pyridoxine/pyridoxamine 5'-phosphate oxidase